MNPATLIDHATDALAALRHRIDGHVVTPDDHDWDEARQAWNLAVDQRPAAVAFPESADDVVAIVDHARERGLRVAAQGTGHGSSAIPTLEDTILVKTSRMKDVAIHAAARWARVEAGAEWIDVAVPAAEHALAPTSGSSPDVGVVGYTLGGGMGFIGRKHGFSAHNVRAIEIVTADGRQVRTDPEHEPELFWALRGGGGSFGVVTAIEIDLHNVPQLYAGAMFWPVERAVEVLTAYSEWTRTTPDEISASGRVMQFPPLPDVPEPLRGNAFVVIDGAFIGDEAAACAILAPLRALHPIIDTFAVAEDPTVLSHLHMDPPTPVPAAGDGMLVDELTAEAIEALVKAAGIGDGSPLLMVELRQLGGAVARPAPSHGAIGTIDAAHALYAVGIAPDAEAKGAVDRAADTLKDALAPWDHGRAYFNFDERDSDPARLYADGTYARLTRVRSQYDPHGLFQANHTIAP